MHRTVLNSSNQIIQIIRYAAPASDPMANLRTNTGDQVFNLSQAWNWEDDFYHDDTAFYRNATGTNSSFGVTRYATFMDLVNRNVAQTISSANWPATDIFIPVPAPGAIALLGVAGLVGARRRK